MIKRLPNALSEKELIESLQLTNDSLPDGERVTNNDILNFLSFYKIEPGKHNVRFSVLNALYRKWSNNPENRDTFLRSLNNYLPKAKFNQSHGYNINISALELGIKTAKLIESSQRDKRKNPKYIKHFEEFLKAHDVRTGKTWVESYLIYFLYDKWTYETKRTNVIGTKVFNNFLRLYFQCKRNKSDQLECFSVNRSIMKYFSEGQAERVRNAHSERIKKTRRRKKASRSTKSRKEVQEEQE